MEYTLLLAFLAMASAGILSQLGVTIQGPWANANTTLEAAAGTGDSASPGQAGGDTGGSGGGHDGHGGHHDGH